jgi:sugar phosphate isomerase/epimerase
VRLSVTNLGAPSWPLAKLFAEAARLGGEGVELRCLQGKLLGPDMDAAARAAAKRLSRETGLPIVALGASSAFSSPDAAARAAQEKDLRGMIELAADLGAPMVRAYGGGFPRAYSRDADRSYGGSLPAGIDPDVVCAYIAESLDRVAARARELGVLIVIETHDGLSSARLMANVLGRVRSPEIQALWDVLHPTRMGESPRQVWELIGPRVRHVHFKDARRDAAGRWRAALLGEGEVPLRECLRVLRAAGYSGWLTLEWEKYWEPEIAEPEVAFPQMIATMRGYLAEG